MPDGIPAPCRVQRGTNGDRYYFDGVNPMTLLSAGSGLNVDLNNVFGTLTTYTATTAQFDNIQNYLVARKVVFDQLAACETCPEFSGVGSLDEATEAAYEDLTG